MMQNKDFTNRVGLLCNTLNAQQSLSNHIYSQTKNQREYDLSIFLRQAQTLLGEMEEEITKLKAVLEEVREIAWGRDVPHSTVPEYVELHEGMQEIMKYIDKHANLERGE